MTVAAVAGRSRRLRVSLRLAMLAILMLAVPLARLTVRARAQREAVAAIEAAGGRVRYEWQEDPTAKGPPGPGWLHRLIGPDYFQAVVGVILEQEGMGDELMPMVARFDRLEQVRITGTRISDAGIAHLAGLSRLRFAYFQWDTNMTGACLVHLRDKPDLRYLGVFTNGLEDEHLAVVGEMTGLETLQLRSERLTDAGMEHLRGLTGLTRLMIDLSQVTSRGLECLSGMKELEEIDLPSTVESLAPLKGLTALRQVTAAESSVDDAGMGALSALTQLESLILGRSRVTGPGLAELRGLDRLEVLALNLNPITDEGLRAISRLPRLKELYLHGTSITDAGLEHLRSLPSLQILGVKDTRVTAEGLDALKEMPSLRKVEADVPWGGTKSDAR